MKTKSILLFGFLMIYISAITQPIIKGQKAAGGSADDNFSCMVRTTDGGLLAGGSSYSNISGDKTEDSRGDADYWIVKFDAAGKKQWDKTIGGNYRDILVSIIRTADGGYMLGGYSISGISGERTVANEALPDFWIVKLDENFNIQWDKAYGTPPEYEGATYREILYSIQQTSDSGYILSGTTSNNDAEYDNEFFVVKADKNGNAEWSTRVGADEATGVYAQETDGGYVVGGSTYNRELSFFKAIKLDPSGNIIWNNNYPTVPSGNDYYSDAWAKCMIQSANGNFIIGGYLVDDNSINGSYDYRLLEIDGDGAVVKDKRIGGAGRDQLFAIIKTTDGGFLLGGSSASDISGNKTENHRGTGTGVAAYDYWIVKTDANYNVQWDKTVGGDEEDDLYSVLQIAPDKYLLGGKSLSGISGDKKVTSKGGADYWGVVVKYTAPSPVQNKISFTVYPNPASTVLNIQLTGKSVFNITDRNGKTFITKTIDNKGVIDVRILKMGLYFISTPSGSKQQVIIGR